MKKVYIIDEQGYFIAEHWCQPNPIHPGEYLYPSSFVEIEPPKLMDGQLAKYDANKNTWLVVQNYCGVTIYNKVNSCEYKVNPAVDIEEGYTDVTPPRNDIQYYFEDNKWKPNHGDLINKALSKNHMVYTQICNVTDNEFNKYTKRKALELLFDGDISDYNDAMNKYKNATIIYKQNKDTIPYMSDEQLIAFIFNP